jgi:predicted outer membrane repeat protein
MSWRREPLGSGVALIGGFAGPGTVDPDARDPNMYETILSGDLSGNDIEVTNPQNLPNEPTRAENSLHVVTGSGTNETAVIDGFTITAGNANGASVTNDPTQEPLVLGGGMYCETGSPTVNNCTFIHNSADWYGGGMCNMFGSNPKIIQCKFIANAVDVLTLPDYNSSAGGMANGFDSNPEVTACFFVGTWGNHAAGLANWTSNPTISQCQFIGNTGKIIGALVNWDNSDPMVINCIFSNNSAKKGGGMYLEHNCQITLSNCTFSRNTATQTGGAIQSEDSNAELVNCILWEDNPQEIYVLSGSSPVVNYSDVEGGWPGVGNIEEDPCFVDPTNGDYHLKSQVGHWDSNGNTWVCDGVTSLCIDAGDPTSDYAAELWPHGKFINMGAYGNTPEASMSDDLLIGNIADLNNDGMVNLEDYSYWVMHWMKEEILLAADLDRNGKVGVPDAVMFFENWLWEE